MSTISFDGQSFMVDGRRIWLVSGAIHYSRTPHQLWRKRIRAAKEAGLNCIETYVFWNAHETRPGRFDWEGDLDLRRFVQTVGEEGMWCILRPGPYVCAEWDFGGLPAWLHKVEGMKLRQSSPAFLEACARYLGAVMDQVRDLQVTTPVEGAVEKPPIGNLPGEAAGGFTGGGRGPILMMQAENEWFCHNPDEADAYLHELVRYLRENGCEVPINNCNNLWQEVDGTISTWNGARNLAIDMRQLAVVQPDAPRLVTEYWPGWFDQWDAEHSAVDPELHLYRTAGILATGSQVNFYMFHGGTNFGFRGGRTVNSPACFMTTSYDYDAPLREAGGRGRKYQLTKRIATFASQFAHVFAHLDPLSAHAAVTPTEEDHPLSILHTRGTQGEVVFLLKSAKDRRGEVDLLLPDGLRLPVPMGTDRAAWLLLRTSLGGAAMLDHTNLRPWAIVDRKMLVLFGPAGADGVVSIDGAPFQVKVPAAKAKEPLVERHENIVVVVLNDQQVDEAYLFDAGLAIGAAGLDDAGQPIAGRGMVTVDLAGTVKKARPTPARKTTAPRLGGWQHAALAEIVRGEAEGFRPIDGPASLEELGAEYGYGWYRIRGAATRGSGKLWAPESGDRLHVYSGGRFQKILGLGPAAETDPTDLKLGDDLVILADNLGRYNYSQAMGEKKGLFGHLHHVKPMKLPKAKVIEERAADPFALGGWIHHARRGDLPQSQSLVWKIKPAARKPVVLEIRGATLRGTLLVNGEPLGVYLGGDSGHLQRWLLTPGTPGEGAFTGGQNEVKLSLFRPDDKAVAAAAKDIRLFQVTSTPTEKAAWSFLPWTLPAEDAFGPVPRSPAGARSVSDRPAWFRATFRVKEATVPLWLEPRGMTKGQIYLNGHNVGRYFVATPRGKAVPPQERYYLPEPWLRTDGPNELMLFDEHGASPAKAKLVYDAMGPYGG